MLLNLRAVDCVQIFNNETPEEIIKLVAPQVLVKGGDWRPEQILGSEFVLAHGGEVKVSLLNTDTLPATSSKMFREKAEQISLKLIPLK